MKTQVDMMLDLGEGFEHEWFDDFNGHIPSINDEVTFYRKEHDGERYHGVVTKIEHRIERIWDSEKSKHYYKQQVRVTLKWEDGMGTL